MSEIVALVNGTVVGRVEQGASGNLSFEYFDSWRDNRRAFPISLSMPLAQREHGDGVVRPFLRGLLPDGEQVLQKWGRMYHASPRNPFALLSHMGEDCAGAVQFATPKRVDHLEADEGDIVWLSESEVASRLKDLVEGHGTGRFAWDNGQFSLAGAQPKTALFHSDEGWGVPSGSWPTTHILKPPAQQGFDDFDINEHFCLTLADAVGLEVASSELRTFADQRALVVERFDRFRTPDGRVARIHQEDFCQALAHPPETKYEHEGGPGVPEMVGLLDRESSDPGQDVAALLDAIALNWVIAGPDAHAKNYALLVSADGAKMAPLYDLLSAFAHPDQFPYRRIKLAMRIDREYHLWKVRKRHWVGLAEKCVLDAEPVVQRTRELIAMVPGAVATTATKLRNEGLGCRVVDLLESDITSHSMDLLKLLD
jgi:serine/threonine-protein kinase HipA